MFKRSGKLRSINLTDLTALTPAMVAKAYNFPSVPANIRQQCVAIIELGGGLNYAFLAAYCKQMRVSPPQLYIHRVDGAPIEIIPNPEGADGEVSLDACIISVLCPGIKILMVYAPNTDQGFADAIAYCATSPLNPAAVSISWGGPECDWDTNGINLMEAAIKQCVNQNINVYVAAGDSGCDDGVNDGQDHVDYPASSPQVIACGGTRLQLDNNGNRESEIVWGPPASQDGATGGGISTLFALPPAQANLPATLTQAAKRLVPDISGNADPASGYLVNVDGQTMAIGGTSAVAPLYTALNALLVGHIGHLPLNLVQTLYANPSICFDVITGTNQDLQGSGAPQHAAVGFDLCAGLGVVNGQSLLSTLSQQQS
jgi:kumamolisin